MIILPTLPHHTGNHPEPDKSFQFVSLPSICGLSSIFAPLPWDETAYLGTVVINGHPPA